MSRGVWRCPQCKFVDLSATPRLYKLHQLSHVYHNSTAVAKAAGISVNSASSGLKRLRELGLLMNARAVSNKKGGVQYVW